MIGHKGSGKSVLSRALASGNYCQRFEVVKMAGPLKAMLAAYLHYVGIEDTYDLIEGSQKETPISALAARTPRHAMQTLGTEWGRDLIGPDLWIDAFRRRAGQFENVVCDDVRFENEAFAIADLGGINIKIVRPGLAVDNSHASEREIDSLPYHHMVVNDSTEEALALRVLLLVADIRRL